MRASALVFLLLACFPLSAEEIITTRFADDAGDRVPSHTVVPSYPEDALRDRIEGEVQVCYHVDVKGRPYRIAVRQSTNRIFEGPSKSAVKASMYFPLDPGEKTSGIKTCRTFRFELQPLIDD